ncbi:ferrichrome ABC transporter substrate-binding protein [Nodularia spumigena CENA596]|uniref:Ferrichrome ABC transporter substrate-binding protein n=1 Tax=Nodularia spumigena CENA596 TaxID=1819295 RepID=A0A166I677_NODSP|nr:iron-siderophore ABC transporter substrate-binding protein [Nodularia spumigena]KZL47948.1 ferrichrome ABC transporter substrate-binding protein [Nodularia spumigena CENA596]
MSKFTRRDFLTAATASALTVACNRSPRPQNFSKIATRVVALEWVYAENLLALGIQPVGVADIRGYQKYVNVQPSLAESVVDVGTRQEPSLEAIAQLKPDLILGVELRHQTIYDTLSAIAPTLLFNPYPSAGDLSQLDEMQQTFRQIADRVNRRDVAETVIQQTQTTIQKAATAIKNTEKLDFILAQFSENTPQMRLFTDNSMAVQILTAIGLNNTWKGKIDRFGFNTVWVEALPKVENTNFIYIPAPNSTYQKQLQNNPVWKGLKFVQQKRLYAIAPDTWLFGGHLSAQILIEKVIKSLTNNREQI